MFTVSLHLPNLYKIQRTRNIKLDSVQIVDKCLPKSYKSNKLSSIRSQTVSSISHRIIEITQLLFIIYFFQHTRCLFKNCQWAVFKKKYQEILFTRAFQ